MLINGVGMLGESMGRRPRWAWERQEVWLGQGESSSIGGPLRILPSFHHAMATESLETMMHSFQLEAMFYLCCNYLFHCQKFSNDLSHTAILFSDALSNGGSEKAGQELYQCSATVWIKTKQQCPEWWLRLHQPLRKQEEVPTFSGSVNPFTQICKKLWGMKKTEAIVEQYLRQYCLGH